MPSPINPDRTVTICSGVYTRGVYGAVRCLTDQASAQANHAYLRTRVRERRDVRRTHARPRRAEAGADPAAGQRPGPTVRVPMTAATSRLLPGPAHVVRRYGSVSPARCAGRACEPERGAPPVGRGVGPQDRCRAARSLQSERGACRGRAGDGGGARRPPPRGPHEAGLRVPPPAFRTAPTNLVEFASRPELSRKRNLGLAVARMAAGGPSSSSTTTSHSTSRRPVAAQHGLDAAAAVGSRSRIGPTTRRRPRQSGEWREQEVFVGPSALLVDMESAPLGQFPTIYNEGRSSSSTPWRNEGEPIPRPRPTTAVQPVPGLDRDGDEEFGDVIVEGLWGSSRRRARRLSDRTSYWQGSSRAAGLS